MTVSNEENTIKLPAKVFEFLKLLMAHANQTVTKEQAIELVWAGNVEVGKRGLGNAIWHLRKTFADLGAEPEAIFKTITKVGYQLLVLPEAVDVETAPLVDEQGNAVKPSEGDTIRNTFSTQHNKSANFLHNKLIYLAVTIALFALWYALKPAKMIDAPLRTEDSARPNSHQLKASRITNFEGVEELPAISPNGQYMAFQWLQQNENNQLFIRDLHDNSAPLRQVTISADNEVSPVWSPDSQKIAYIRINSEGVRHLFIRELITNQDQLVDSNVDYNGYMRGISWSQDGSRVAYSKDLEDRAAIFQYRFADQSIRQYSFPKSGEQDRLMVWSEKADKLAFVRSSEMSASLMTADEHQIEEVLVGDEKQIIGLDWHYKSNKLYFNTSRDADFVIETFDFSDGETNEFHRDQTIYSVAIDQKEQALYYSRHIAQEHITISSIETGQVQKQLVSSSRDLYGQYVPTSGDILFFSNRSGAWELWLKRDNTSKQITDDQGPFAIPAISPVEPKFVLPLKAKGKERFELYLGELPSGNLERLIEIDGDVRKPSFSQDGKSIYFSSNKHGQWGIYKYDMASEELTLLVPENGKYALESDDGGIYFTKDSDDGIFYQSANGGKQTTITENLSIRDWGSFFLLNGDVHYLKRTKENDALMRVDAQGIEYLVFTLPPFSIRNEKALSPAGDGSVIATMLGINDADIYKVPLN